jgi:hypothetical protein
LRPPHDSGFVQGLTPIRVDLIRNCTQDSFTIGAWLRPWLMSKMLVGIDLFVGRCIEGVQLAKVAAPVTYPPQLTRRQPPKRLGVGACKRFQVLAFRKGFPQ